MAPDILSVAESLWNGELSTATIHPVNAIGGFVEITDGVGFSPPSPTSRPSAPMTDTCWWTPGARRWPGWSTTTSGRGAPSVSTRPSTPTGTLITSSASRYGRKKPVRGWAPPEVTRTTPCPPASTATSSPPGTTPSSTAASSASKGSNGRPSTAIPTAPTTNLDLSVGGVGFALRHEKGETDDHTVTWQPERGCSAAATCSSGPPPTPATRKRCSVTHASGRPPCAGWCPWTPSPVARPWVPRHRGRARP